MIDVLHVTPAVFGSEGIWGGGERYPIELARAQSPLMRTRLVSFGVDTRRSVEDGLDVTVLRTRWRWKGHEVNAVSERLAGLIAQSRVVHVHQYRTALASLTIMIAGVLRRPVFVTDHGGAAPNLNARLRLHRLVRGNLSISAFASRSIPELADRTTVVYGGVNSSVFYPPPAAVRRPRRIVFVGRVMPHKGLDVLLRAVDASTEVHIYGRPYSPRYLKHLESLAHGLDVTFHLAADDGEIVRALQEARVAVLPSVYRAYDGRVGRNTEYFGLTLVEAMACGTPVVATLVGGMPEVVVDGRTGRLVEPSDVGALRAALVEILDAPEQRWNELSRAAIVHVADKFTWERVAQRCISAYST
jgi:glycosyltransferase involved in cell wall biosynthesis